MKCSTCGYEIQSGAKFCVQCGNTIIAASPAAAGFAPLNTPTMSPASRAAAASATGSRPAYSPSPAAAEQTMAASASTL